MLDKKVKVNDTRRQSSILDFCTNSSPKQKDTDAGLPAAAPCKINAHCEQASLSSDHVGTGEGFKVEAAFSAKSAMHSLKSPSEAQDAELPEPKPNDQVRYPWLRDIRDAAGRTTG